MVMWEIVAQARHGKFQAWAYQTFSLFRRTPAPSLGGPERASPGSSPALAATRALFKSPFAFEWLGVGVVALIDVIWAARSGFRLIYVWDTPLLIGVAYLAAAGFRHVSMKRTAVVAEYLALTFAGTLATCMLTYLCLASSGPPIDSELLVADQALGFHWLTGFQFLMKHPALAHVASLIYGSLKLQILYVGIFLGAKGRISDVREIFWIVLLAAVLAGAGAAAFPAYGPFKMFGLDRYGAFLPEMEHLKSGHALTFSLAHLTGVVSFPSFHTSMALILIYAFRQTGIHGWIMIAWNALMLPTIPYFGGHYLVDMLAGAGVTLLTVAIVRYAFRLVPSSSAMRGTDTPRMESLEPSGARAAE